MIFLLTESHNNQNINNHPIIIIIPELWSGADHVVAFRPSARLSEPFLHRKLTEVHIDGVEADCCSRYRATSPRLTLTRSTSLSFDSWIGRKSSTNVFTSSIVVLGSGLGLGLDVLSLVLLRIHVTNRMCCLWSSICASRLLFISQENKLDQL